MLQAGPYLQETPASLITQHARSWHIFSFLLLTHLQSADRVNLQPVPSPSSGHSLRGDWRPEHHVPWGNDQSRSDMQHVRAYSQPASQPQAVMDMVYRKRIYTSQRTCFAVFHEKGGREFLCGPNGRCSLRQAAWLKHSMRPSPQPWAQQIESGEWNGGGDTVRPRPREDPSRRPCFWLTTLSGPRSAERRRAWE